MSEGDTANNSLGTQSINCPHCMAPVSTKRKPECQTNHAQLIAPTVNIEEEKPVDN